MYNTNSLWKLIDSGTLNSSQTDLVLKTINLIAAERHTMVTVSFSKEDVIYLLGAIALAVSEAEEESAEYANLCNTYQTLAAEIGFNKSIEEAIEEYVS